MDISKIASQAAHVASVHADLTSARSAEEQAEAELLDALIAAVKPALPALSSRIVASERTTGIATDRQRDAKTWREEKGLCVTGTPGPARAGGRDTRGEYKGYDLFLLADGTWLELAYEGSWSNWQGESCLWSTTSRKLTSLDVAREYDDVPALVERIEKALAAYANGNATKRAQAARSRAEELRAVLTLIR